MEVIGKETDNAVAQVKEKVEDFDLKQKTIQMSFALEKSTTKTAEDNLEIFTLRYF